MKAVSLFSGGLDSQLAAKIVAMQGIEVVLVTFCSPFFGTNPKLEEAARRLGLDLIPLDISDDYMQVLKNPRYGYGKNMNPCIDCHAFMLQQAGRYMEKIGASFIITGEVLGQRPMSQNKSALDAVAKHSGYRHLILRPLSAQLLPPSLPETEGWVDRNRLLGISGRSRDLQMKLAEELGIVDYPSPAGGCLLTQESFSQRLRKLLAVKPEATAEDMYILKQGRHFWLGDNLLAVGRKMEENRAIEQMAKENDYLLKEGAHPGPTALLRPFGGEVQEEVLTLAAAICARYSDAGKFDTASVRIWHPGKVEKLLTVTPLKPEDVPMTY